LSKATGREGVRWRTTGIRTEIPTPPPYREYVWTVSRANGISNTGWIAATYDVRISGVSTTRAIVWNGTSVNSINLEVLPSGSRSAAHDVNDLGFVVGYSNRAGHPNRAFIWHKHMGMVELPPLHTAGECQAHAINDSRRQDLQQVAGFCVNAAGNRRAVRWDVMVD
jgi:probable HAF family extracellular repeat protein